MVIKKRQKLINWLDEIGESRKELPYEITKVFFDNEKNELKDAINQSFDNIERVLAFSNLLSIEFEDDEDVWPYLLAALDDTSYYACSAMPLVRQLLEPSIEFLYGRIEKENRIDWASYSSPKCPKEFGSLSGFRYSIANEAWELSCNMGVLNGRYLLLSSSKELIDWSKYYLEYSAKLILLAARFSTNAQ